MAYSHVLLTGLALLSFATLPTVALKSAHLENNAMNEATALKPRSAAYALPSLRPCFSEEGAKFTIMKRGDIKTFTKFCRITGGAGSTNFDDATIGQIADLVYSQSSYSGSFWTREELTPKVRDATANLWIETADGKVVSHAAFLNGVKDAQCAMGEMGCLVVHPDYQSWGLSRYMEELSDVVLDDGFITFYTETLVTNRRSIKLQMPQVRPNQFFFINMIRKIKGMGNIWGFLKANREFGPYCQQGAVIVIIMSYTGTGLFPMRSFLTDARDKRCGEQLLDSFTADGGWSRVELTKGELREQVENDPSMKRRLGRTGEASDSGELTDLINTHLKLDS